MYRGFVAALGGAALVIAGLTGCTTDDDGTTANDTNAEETVEETIVEEETTPAEETDPADPAATEDAAADAASVTIDGEDQEIQGTVVCTEQDDNLMIVIGDATQGVSATVTAGDDPQVNNVALGDVDGVALGWTEGAEEGEANVEKDGDDYTITGTATGIDPANPMETVSQTFEIAVSCP